jgi:hypothetical protein
MNQRCPKNINAPLDHTEYRDTVWRKIPQIVYQVLTPQPPDGELEWVNAGVDEFDNYKGCQGGCVTRVLINGEPFYSELCLKTNEDELEAIKTKVKALQGMLKYYTKQNHPQLPNI